MMMAALSMVAVAVWISYRIKRPHIVGPPRNQQPGADVSLKRITITGQVVAPGVYQVSPTASIAHCVLLAGGPLAGADIKTLNLNKTVASIQHIHISTTQETPSPVTQSNSAVVSFNKATPQELEKVPGIGPKTAQEIVEYRRKKGPFKTVTDLVNVRYIGEKTVEKLRPYFKP